MKDVAVWWLLVLCGTLHFLFSSFMKSANIESKNTKGIPQKIEAECKQHELVRKNHSHINELQIVLTESTLKVVLFQAVMRIQKPHINQVQWPFLSVFRSHLIVKGPHVWCQGCGHGGHLIHMQEWFSKRVWCPAGCGHMCEFT